MTTTAIILAAGLGSRLQPLTSSIPKCLTEVNGKPILEQQVEALIKCGVKHIVVVVGYLHDRVRHHVMNIPVGCEYAFIHNPDYATTNSAYSLYLARDYLRDGAVIVEGDVVFEPAVLEPLFSQDESAWLVDRAKEGDDGCVVRCDDEMRVVEAKILSEPLRDAEGWWKSVGVQKISAHGGQWLGAYNGLLSDKATHKDEIMGELAVVEPLYARSIEGLKWGEIDTRQDLLKVEQTFTQRKLVMVILDGAADKQSRFERTMGTDFSFSNASPLEHADTPVLDQIARHGRTGLVQTMYPGLPLGSVVACLGLLGYNPTRYYPNGRASFEAIAQGVYLDEGDIAFRCNWVKLNDKGEILDATPSWSLSPDEREDTELGFRFYPGQGYRNILIFRADCEPSDVETKEPHEFIGGHFQDLWPTAKNERGFNLATWLKIFMQKNVSPMHILAPWSPSSAPHLPSFCKRHDLDGAVVSAMDFLRGIGKVARMQADAVDGATGYSDTNLSAKLRHTQNALRHNDFVLVHINAPDEESHKRECEGKIRILERIDEILLRPLWEHLEAQYADNYRLAVLPDHYTYVDTGKHGALPVPYAVVGVGIEADSTLDFSEQITSESVLKSYEFLDFMRGG